MGEKREGKGGEGEVEGRKRRGGEVERKRNPGKGRGEKIGKMQFEKFGMGRKEGRGKRGRRGG